MTRKAYHIYHNGAVDVQYDLNTNMFGGAGPIPDDYVGARKCLNERGYPLPSWKLDEDITSVNINLTTEFTIYPKTKTNIENVFN